MLGDRNSAIERTLCSAAYSAEGRAVRVARVAHTEINRRAVLEAARRVEAHDLAVERVAQKLQQTVASSLQDWGTSADRRLTLPQTLP